jgi:hypothetical protein
MGEREVPLAGMVEALADLKDAGDEGLSSADAALAALRGVDDKAHLAFALNATAAICVGKCRDKTVQAYAEEAMSIAGLMQRRGEAVIAQAILAVLDARRAGCSSNDRLKHLHSQIADREQFSARVRELVEQVVAIGTQTMRRPRPDPTASAKSKKRR